MQQGSLLVYTQPARGGELIPNYTQFVIWTNLIATSFSLQLRSEKYHEQ